MATSREDARPLQRCGWRANGRLRYPATYTTSWDATCASPARPAKSKSTDASWLRPSRRTNPSNPSKLPQNSKCDSPGQACISWWGDILANAAKTKGVRGSIIDGLSRDVEGSEGIGYHVYGRSVTMIRARNRVIQTGSGEPVVMASLTVREDDYVIADRGGTVFVPAERIEEVLDLAERIARRQNGMVEAVRGRPPSRRSCTQAVRGD